MVRSTLIAIWSNEEWNGKYVNEDLFKVIGYEKK